MRLSARQLARDALLVADELHELERFTDALLQFLTRDAFAPETERDILVDVQVREEGIALEDGVHIPLICGEEGDINALQFNEPAGRLLKATDHAERRGLAASGRPEEGEELAIADVKGDAVNGHLVAEALRYVYEPNIDF